MKILAMLIWLPLFSFGSENDITLVGHGDGSKIKIFVADTSASKRKAIDEAERIANRVCESLKLGKATSARIERDLLGDESAYTNESSQQYLVVGEDHSLKIRSLNQKEGTIYQSFSGDCH